MEVVLKKKRFADLIFLAAPIDSIEVPLCDPRGPCSLIHFEVKVQHRDKERSEDEKEDWLSEEESCTTVSKVLWVKNVKTGELVDFTQAADELTVTIHYSKSFSSGMKSILI